MTHCLGFSSTFTHTLWFSPQSKCCSTGRASRLHDDELEKTWCVMFTRLPHCENKKSKVWCNAKLATIETWLRSTRVMCAAFHSKKLACVKTAKTQFAIFSQSASSLFPLAPSRLDSRLSGLLSDLLLCLSSPRVVSAGWNRSALAPANITSSLS